MGGCASSFSQLRKQSSSVSQRRKQPLHNPSCRVGLGGYRVCTRRQISIPFIMVRPGSWTRRPLIISNHRNYMRTPLFLLIESRNLYISADENNATMMPFVSRPCPKPRTSTPPDFSAVEQAKWDEPGSAPTFHRIATHWTQYERNWRELGV